MLRAVLTRRYTVQPSGNGRASLITSEIIGRILELHGEGKGPVEIAGIVGLGRKQVARVIAEAPPAEGQAEDDGLKPIRYPRRPKPEETFPAEPGHTA